MPRQGGPSGRAQPFVDIELRLSVISLYYGGTFTLMSANSLLRPDGPPCSVIRANGVSGQAC